MIVEVPLMGLAGVRAYALIDAADATAVGQYRWFVKHGYVARNMIVDGRRRSVYLHRFLLGLEPGDERQGDHINRDRLDNRRANLRVVTFAENRQNTSAFGSTSRFRGVTWDRTRSLWQTDVTVAGQRHKLGRFADEVEAARVVDAFRAEHLPFAQPDPALAALEEAA